MIDKLISSDLAALAADDRQAVPPFEALPLGPIASAPKAPRMKGVPWLLPVAPIAIVLVTTGVLDTLNSDLESFPQLSVALAVAIMAFGGLVFPGFAKARPFADVLAASVFIPLATAAFLVEWRHHMADCAYFDGDGLTIGPCQPARFMTTTRFALISWAIALGIAGVAARFVRRPRLLEWSIPANLAILTVLLTWLGVNVFMDRAMDLVRFHYAPWAGGARITGFHRARIFFGSSALEHFVEMDSQQKQWWAVEAGAALFGLAISIGVALVRERIRPSRWLRILESPVIMLLGIIVTTACVVVGAAQQRLFLLHRGDWDDIPWFAAWASVGAVVAYASMLLRRRRREALS